ncbi:MAG: sulfatase [Planctomycetota bacterium]
MPRKSSLVLALLVYGCLASSVYAGRPNILFILADDHTTQAISCYGGPLAEYAKTTNIDRLASQGVRLTHCFCNNSICTPSRASILTGQYSHRNGSYLLDQPIHDDSVTFLELLQESGYQTALFGKWHLVNRPKGFDDYRILPRQGRYQDPQFLSPDSDELTTMKGWSTDVITDLTIDFMKAQKSDRPFLAMCQYKATHDPWASRKPYSELWANEDLPEPKNLLQEFDVSQEAGKRTTLKLEQINQRTYPHKRLDTDDKLKQRNYIYQQYIKSFLRCGRVLDENVGRLLKFLDDSGLAQNTIVIYTADQGHFLGEHGFFSKRFMYDESMRMPFVIRFPDGQSAGTICDDMISNVDFAPTVLELSGVAPTNRIQGRSFLSNLRGQTPDDWPEAVYYRYWQHLLHRNVTAHYGIRTRSEKLIYFHGQSLGRTDFEDTDPQWEYYNLDTDPNEIRNRIDDSEVQERVEKLRVELARLQERVGDKPVEE